MRSERICECCNQELALDIGTKVKIEDNYNEHPSYVKDSIVEIKGYEDGYYIVGNESFSSMCSDGEIAVVIN